MALTFTQVKGARGGQGQVREEPYDVLFDSSYPAGGEALSPRSVGLIDVVGFEWWGSNTVGSDYIPIYDVQTGKIVVNASGQGGTTTYAPGGGDINGSTNATSPNADAAAPVNDADFLARTTFTVLAGTMTPTTQPDVPRNIMITVFNDSGGALDLFEGTTTFLITGTDFNGFAQTESVTLTSTAGNKSVANNQSRYVQGVKPFQTVTNVTITNAPAGALKGSLGPGSRIGLPVPLRTPAVADVIDITVNGATLTPTATTTAAGGVDTTNMAINVGTIADGADANFVFNASAEVPAGTDLSTVSFRLNFIGRG